MENFDEFDKWLQQFVKPTQAFFLLNGETHNQFIKVLLEDVSFIKAFPCQTFVLAIAAIWYYCFQFFILYSYS